MAEEIHETAANACAALLIGRARRSLEDAALLARPGSALSAALADMLEVDMVEAERLAQGERR
jgi:hypothetical protein